MSAPSPPGTAFPGSCCTTISSSAVLERHGDAIRFHPTCSTSPGTIATNPGRSRSRAATKKAASNEPSASSGTRSSPPAASPDLDDLNAQAEAWCRGLAADRRCPDETGPQRGEVFAEEARDCCRCRTIPIPCVEQVAVSVGKTPYVRFDLNDYSVPHTHVRRDPDRAGRSRPVRIVDGPQISPAIRAATTRASRSKTPPMSRRWSRGKRAARQHAPPIASPRPRRPARPCSSAPPNAGQSRRHHRRPDAAARALRRRQLRCRHPRGALRDVPHPNAVRLALERRRETAGRPRRSPSPCRRMCRTATPCGRMRSKPTTS
jgi:hypothetical protein